jgi:hypothetical protein
MIFSQMPYQQQQRQQHPQQETAYPQPQPPLPPTPPSSLPAIPPPPVPLAPMLDDVLLVDGIPRQIDPQLAEQLFYSYDWFQEEMATYYTL